MFGGTNLKNRESRLSKNRHFLNNFVFKEKAAILQHLKKRTNAEKIGTLF